MFNRILNYWYTLEFFTPCWPIKRNKDRNLYTRELPWLTPQNNPKIRLSYDVYLGQFKSNDLIAFLFQQLGLSLDASNIEHDNSITCVCALKVDQNGQYVANSFALSSFVWAIGRLVSAGSISARLSITELEQIEQSVNAELQETQNNRDSLPISTKKLEEILVLALKKSMVELRPVPSLWAREKKQYISKNGNFPPLDPATELMRSFYLKDLDNIKNMPTTNVKNYVSAMIQKQKKRIDIDSNVPQMQYWLRPDKFPLGLWPSTYTPSLMQQIGINLAISKKEPVFSVNGPPGTGKTTLLKEIIASNIVQRAIIMEGYSNPDAAFKKMELKNPPDIYNKTFFALDPALSNYGILIASNNNAAVENISTNIPMEVKKGRINRFVCADTKDNTDTYFSDIATKLIEKPAWGLISARLGNKSNIKSLKERLWWADDGVTLKRYYDENERPDWNTARKNFRKALQAVQAAQEEIISAQAMLQNEQQLIKALQDAYGSNEKVKALFSEKSTNLSKAQQTLKASEQQLMLQEQNALALRARFSLFKRLFWRLLPNDAIVQAWKQTKQAVDQLTIQIVQQKNDCQLYEAQVYASQVQYQLSSQALLQAQRNLRMLQNKIAPVRSTFADNWPDTSFWQDITSNKRAQAACPWTHLKYDRLREELFFQALMLHKAFVLSSQCVKKNISRLFSLWEGKFNDSDGKSAGGHLLNTLLLVIPVISTTFASVQTFLAEVQENKIGLLIVDEAGQATPQSAIGALWRAQRAVIVGDPLQVEPIMTIPKELQKRFADENNIPSAYRCADLSVQILADQLNCYGGVRTIAGEQLWVGCPLVIHRRCNEPMFTISNEVAYNSRMISMTSPPDSSQKFLFQSSVWLDCKGSENGNKDHTVAQQVKLAATLFATAIDFYNGLPDLYIITPFTSVEHALKVAFDKVFKHKLPQMDHSDIYDWLKENCGTIHTFQGKEASEVLLVLGCDAQSGLNAAEWVGQKPNIINVAVSRAKNRLAVIGDYDLWKNIPYVETVCKSLTSIANDSNYKDFINKTPSELVIHNQLLL